MLQTAIFVGGVQKLFVHSRDVSFVLCVPFKRYRVVGIYNQRELGVTSFYDRKFRGDTG